MSQLVHATVLGKGSPLIVLHGYFGMSDNWKSMGLRFSEYREVHLIDQRNHGRSFHSDEFDYELLVEDVVNYIISRGLSKVDVLGHSMGGKVAMLLAVNYPELINAIIVADIAPRFYPPHHEQILSGLSAVNFDIHTSRKEVEEVLKIYVGDMSVVQFLMKNVYWKEKGRLAFRFNRESLIEHNDEVGEALPSFTHYDGPVLFLRGGDSDYITNNDEPLMRSHFSNFRIATVNNAGHWLHAENPEQFYEHVVRFLSDL